jgi:hypothetical protein
MQLALSLLTALIPFFPEPPPPTPPTPDVASAAIALTGVSPDDLVAAGATVAQLQSAISGSPEFAAAIGAVRAAEQAQLSAVTELSRVDAQLADQPGVRELVVRRRALAQARDSGAAALALARDRLIATVLPSASLEEATRIRANRALPVQYRACSIAADAAAQLAQDLRREHRAALEGTTLEGERASRLAQIRSRSDTNAAAQRLQAQASALDSAFGPVGIR